MTEITMEFLESKGFKTNHPERVLKKYYLSNSTDASNDFHVTVEQQYIPNTNNLCWNVDCWKANENGVIIKRSSCHFINFAEELLKVLELCGIEIA